MLGEPTSALVEAGCQGTMRVRITLRGVRAHTARPFTGRNAVHRLVPLLQTVADWQGREVTLDGCTYAEQLQVVAVAGGVASNVVPDEAVVTLNHRYAPDRGQAEAEAFLHHLLDPALEPEEGDTWELLDAGDGAPPALDHPLLTGAGRRERASSQGEGRVDRRGVVLGARGARGELRPGRPPPGAPSPGTGVGGPARTGPRRVGVRHHLKPLAFHHLELSACAGTRCNRRWGPGTAYYRQQRRRPDGAPVGRHPPR